MGVGNLVDLVFGKATSADRVLVCERAEQTIQWRPGERLNHLFEDLCDRMRPGGMHHRGGPVVAVDTGDTALTHDQLDARANQLARYLLAQGARPGDRIGLLFDHAVHSYIGMLAVLKINATYVPLDVGFPSDRLSYILRDADVGMVLSLSHLADRVGHLPAALVYVDQIEAQVAVQGDHRLTAAEQGDPADELAYIIYTSGTTGRPKGVAVEHASICNFVRVAVEVYGIQPQDRMYQGMTIAFDFSVEEIWVPLIAGATLVPKPGGSSLLGAELREFIEANAITALCCVPTLLATLDEDLPRLRFLLVSGEACPQDLIARWHRPGRRFLNVYGPTEATVTATWTSVHPDRPVTIGVPLPTYSAVILDPAGEEKALLPGEVGEIGIAGIGLARGYLNRDDLTDRAFIRDFVGIDNNPSGRIYRTGDLGRINDNGEIEYHGRIDTQVKIRGYRVELTEIESVLLQVPGIAQAVVDTYEPEPGTVELVAYYSRRTDTADVKAQQVYEHLRGRLPRYMVPAYLEELAVIPMLPSDKADRNNLPVPSGRRSTAVEHAHVAAATAIERFLADALADVLRLEQVSVDSHFFDDLGANSLLLAQFCARVRKRTDLPPVSMKDVYLHPTIRSLAAFLGNAVPAVESAAVDSAAVERAVAAVKQPAPTSASPVLCGALQLLVFLGVVLLGALVFVGGFEWIRAATNIIDTYLRSLVFASASLLATCAVPILAKWVLVGRWKSREIPVWSLPYVRFWLVKTLIRANPMVLFAGSPLYVLYLRALGAKIGRDVAIFSRTVPVCTDLLTIGDRTVIRKDSSFTCYRAHAGQIQTGRVTLGNDVVIGEETTLDIETSMGDGAQIGHASSLHVGQAISEGQRWHGSPARQTDVDYRSVAPVRCGTLRRVLYSLGQVLTGLLLAGPLALAILITLLTKVPLLADLLGPGHSLATGTFYRTALVISLVLFFGIMLLGLVAVATIPRMLNLAIKPDTVYPLYGIHYWVQGTIGRLTNSKFFMRLFGDSSYIVGYLRYLGYDLSRVEQTGSNVGNELKHDSPYLSFVGTGTMLSDGVSINNADYSSTSFRVSQVSLGSRSFLGNNIAYPSEGRTGDNCLLATKVMVPIDGEVREGVGLLGSPAFEIPRSVQADTGFDGTATSNHMTSAAELSRGLVAKNRYNLATIGLYLAVGWIRFFVVVLIGLTALDLYDQFSFAVIPVAVIAGLLFNVSSSVLVERAIGRFRPLRPQSCSIYDPYYSWHERLWKLEAAVPFSGTPFKNLIWRLLGVRIGRRVFDDGCYIPEKTLVTIGDGCTLNPSSVIQCHSQEEGIFTSDRTTVGADVTVGINAFIHYGVTIGDGAVLDADSFLMKGEQIAPHTRWRGNPAHEIRNADSAPPTAVTSAITAVPAIPALKRRRPVSTCHCSRWRGSCGAA
ncbi:MAG: amino acid adenylation domain-containing protein [Actinomycetota bacterium]|nr:amino acid adenylation domain-containing protein [Actinomycetota bacterium]